MQKTFIEPDQMLLETDDRIPMGRVIARSATEFEAHGLNAAGEYMLLGVHSYEADAFTAVEVAHIAQVSRHPDADDEAPVFP